MAKQQLHLLGVNVHLGQGAGVGVPEIVEVEPCRQVETAVIRETKGQPVFELLQLSASPAGHILYSKDRKRSE